MASLRTSFSLWVGGPSKEKVEALKDIDESAQNRFEEVQSI